MVILLPLLQGNSSGVFDGYWRDADDVPELAIAGSTIELPSSDESLSVGSERYIRSYSDIITHEANLTVPSSELLLDGASIVTTMPRILTVYAQSSLQTLVCGDYVLLSVEFDEAVEVSVADSEALKLYLNTLEYAKYYDGNGTSTLAFRIQRFTAN